MDNTMEELEVSIKSSEGDYGQFVCPANADVGEELLALLKRGTVSVALSGSAFKLKLPKPRNNVFVILNHYTDKAHSSSSTSSSVEVCTVVTICAITASPEENVTNESIKQNLHESFFMDEKYHIANLQLLNNYDGGIRIWRGELFIKTDRFANPQPAHSHGSGGRLIVGNNEATRRNRNLPTVDLMRAGVEEMPRHDAIPILQDPLQNIHEQLSMNGQGAFKILGVDTCKGIEPGSVNCVAGEERDKRAHQSFKGIDQRKRVDQQSEKRNAKLIYCSEEFSERVGLNGDSDCATVFPSNVAVYELGRRNGVKRFQFADGIEGDEQQPSDICRDYLGSGGNGLTFKHVLKDFYFAVKWTHYKQSDIDIWKGFSHDNVMPLLGVVRTYYGCYQIMPLMTGDLNLMVDGGVNPSQWTLVEGNLKHILGGVLRGIDYLHNKGIQHSDLKGGNVLILRKLSCQRHCTNTMHCNCPVGEKCAVKVADFDSVTVLSSSTATGRSNRGTKFYRAPEAYLGGLCETSDMWSFGLIIAQVLLNRSQMSEQKTEVKNIIEKIFPPNHCEKPCHDEHRIVLAEYFYAPAILNTLWKKYMDAPEFNKLTSIVGDCLKFDYKERVKSSDLIDYPFFKD